MEIYILGSKLVMIVDAPAVPGMSCRCPQRREMAADGADVQTVLIQRDGSFVIYQVRTAAAVCTFLMECLVVSWELLIFAA